MKKVVSLGVAVAMVGTSACAHEGASRTANLTLLGIGVAAVAGGVVGLQPHETNEDSMQHAGGGDGLDLSSGLVSGAGYGVLVMLGGVVALTGLRGLTESGQPEPRHESGPPVATPAERTAHLGDVARHLASTGRCAAAGRMLAHITDEDPAAAARLRIEIRMQCPLLAAVEPARH